MHCISSRCLIFPLAHLLIYYVFRRHAAHSNNSNTTITRTETQQSNEHPLPSVAFSLPCRIRRLLRLKLLLTPLYSQLRRRPHVLPEVVVVVATAAASAAVVAVALMPFFSLDFLHDFCLCCPPAVPSSSPLPLSTTYPLCPALPCPMLSAYIG